ncbi:RagB/SusD family nutrient uptake outer membrane protein [Chitinophaga pendula]|uniref:RagB/SusD family nutrient uptake outer membrane protein n=1 Tax=Chitinophaga TaxID=79328 RepID=UPI000BB00377|nr:MULTISPECIES: RagB/SusD family nutrient uptake outer membrane protein [Chitinophaga]ASZ12760.1 RagB/SusD family nutrient uptake outer membrane protein [Chitinophaga sp. MD30]UCJ09620.1 RagB/SusD family nutrient uptake outer membrane protein [Chitinophaga pendula]
MKLNINKLLYTSLAFSVLATGCLADLDLKPTDSVDQATSIKTVSDLNTGVVGVYAGFAAANTQYATSLLTDEATMPLENNTGRGVIVYRWQYDAGGGETAPAWANYYDVIDRGNRLLKVIDGIPATDAELATKNRLKGELLGLRAFAHLELLRYYAVDYEPTSPGVPVMTVSQLSKPGRETVGKVLEQINKDLTDAKALIPTSFTPNTRITLNAITAIQARAALLQKNYDAAIGFATEIINKAALASRTQFPNIWLDTDNTEVIWKLKRDNGQERLGTNYRDLTGRIIYAPAFKLMDLFDKTNDIRFASYFKALNTSPTNPRWTVQKFVGGQAALVNLADAKLFRVAEMYLIRAEAYAKQGAAGLLSGNADLTTLRTARIAGYVPVAYATPDALLTAVIEERFKELAFEAHRYVDLRRNNLPINRGPNDVAQAQGAVNLTTDRREYYIPIPNAEIMANEVIKQHPKWQ